MMSDSWLPSGRGIEMVFFWPGRMSGIQSAVEVMAKRTVRRIGGGKVSFMMGWWLLRGDPVLRVLRDG